MPRPTSGKESITGLTLPSGDYEVVSINNITDGDASKMTPDEQKAFQDRIAKGLGQMDYSLFVQQKLKEAKIKTESKHIASLDFS